MKLRAEKRLEERRKRQQRTTSGPDDTHTLDLTDNTSMISGSHMGNSSMHNGREYHDNRRIYREQPGAGNEYSQQQQQHYSRDYSPQRVPHAYPHHEAHVHAASEVCGTWSVDG